MTLQQNPKARILSRLMTDISEDHFCAQWMTDCEYSLWADLTGTETHGRKGWGISEQEKEDLQVAHEFAEGWIMWSEELGGRVYLSTEEWLAHLASFEDTLPT